MIRITSFYLFRYKDGVTIDILEKIVTGCWSLVVRCNNLGNKYYKFFTEQEMKNGAFRDWLNELDDMLVGGFVLEMQPIYKEEEC